MDHEPGCTHETDECSPTCIVGKTIAEGERICASGGGFCGDRYLALMEARERIAEAWKEAKEAGEAVGILPGEDLRECMGALEQFCDWLKDNYKSQPDGNPIQIGSNAYDLRGYLTLGDVRKGVAVLSRLRTAYPELEKEPHAR